MLTGQRKKKRKKKTNGSIYRVAAQLKKASVGCRINSKEIVSKLQFLEIL